VSAVARQLDAAVAAFHHRPLKDIYRVLVLDGVVLKRKTGAGALARPVLVALGLRPDGKKEIIDFRLATAESAAQWERFLGDLTRRGLTGERLEMLCVDGGSGLLAALPTAFPGVPVQRCWAHKIRNVLNKVHKADQAEVKTDLHRIMNAATLPAAWSAARRLADRWGETCPKAVACLARRPRRPAHLLALPDPRQTQGGPHHQRHRAPIPRGPPPHPPHGHLPGQDLDGPHPIRRAHPRESQPGPQHPLRPDTNLLTLPVWNTARGAPSPVRQQPLFTLR
jgi:hypothetical protein